MSGQGKRRVGHGRDAGGVGRGAGPWRRAVDINKTTGERRVLLLAF